MKLIEFINTLTLCDTLLKFAVNYNNSFIFPQYGDVYHDIIDCDVISIIAKEGGFNPIPNTEKGYLIIKIAK